MATETPEQVIKRILTKPTTATEGGEGQSTSMEIEQLGPVKQQRVIVSAEDFSQAVPDPKRARVTLDPNMKIKVYRFIGHSLFALCKLYFGDEENMIHIHVGSQLMNILFTFHRIKRQEINKTAGNFKAKLENIEYKVSFKTQTYSVKRELVHELLTAVASQFGLFYVAKTEANYSDWMGTAGPYMDFACGFELRMKELRMGHSKMIVGKTGDTIKEVKVDEYGLYGCHHILLEGITWPPEKRSSMPQSLGPMTTMLSFLKSPKDYRGKWRMAAKRAFGHIPEIDNILSVIEDKRAGEIRILISLIADLSLIVGTREANRVFFPPSMIAFMMSPTTIKKSDPTLLLTDEQIKLFNHSGRNAYLAYNNLSKVRWMLNGNFTDNEAEQVVFHSMFGTYKEDLSVLAQITSLSTWKNREELAGCFRKMGSTTKAVQLNMPEFRYYAKMASAAQTKFLSSNFTQEKAKSVFSGYKNCFCSEDMANKLGGPSITVHAGKSIERLCEMLRAVMSGIREKLRKTDMKYISGTVPWKKVAGATWVLDGPEVTEEINERGVFFMGKQPL